MIARISRKYLAEFVYGATDGTVTTFAIISGIMGAALSPSIVLVLGVANVLADGWSMASSNYLSEKSDEAMGHGNHKMAWKTAAVTLVSFVLVGLVPLLPFLGKLVFKNGTYDEFLWSIIFSGLVFVIIGLVRGTVANKSRIKTVFETLVIGGLASAIAYYVGFFLKSYAG